MSADFHNPGTSRAAFREAYRSGRRNWCNVGSQLVNLALSRLR
jgi:hypothetical protein